MFVSVIVVVCFMGRFKKTGRGGGAQGRAVKTSAAQAARAAAATIDNDAWWDDVDVAAPSPEHMLRIYRLDSPCTKIVSEHRGVNCADNPRCMTSLRTRTAQAKLADAAAGSAPEAPEDPPAEGSTLAPRGLKNKGNTCYMNAVMQMLVHSVPVRNAIMSRAHGAINEFSLPLIFARLLHSRMPAVDPKELTDALHLDVTVQQDAQEYLTLFLDFLGARDAALGKSLGALFSGAMLHNRVCSACGGEHKKSDPFAYLTIPSAPTVEEAIRESRKNDKIEGVTCDKCGATDVTLECSVSMKVLPPHLVLHVTRFQYDVVRGVRVKDGAPITFGKTLAASELSGADDDSRIYDLAAVVNHVGTSPQGGHYIAHVRCETAVAPDACGAAADPVDVDAAPAAPTGSWYKFDDDTVTLSTLFKGSATSVASKEAYLLHYVLRESRGGTAQDSAAEATVGELRAAVEREDLLAEQAVVEFAATREAAVAEVSAWVKLVDELCSPAATALMSTGGDDDDDSVAPVAMRFAVSSEWIEQFAQAKLLGKADASARRITNGPLVCQHDMLAPAAQFKAVNGYVWGLLESACCADRPWPIPASLCVVCAAEMAAAKQDSRAQLSRWSDLKAIAALDLDAGGMIVSADFFDKFAAARKRADVAADTDLVADVVCAHDGLAPDRARRVIHTDVFRALIDEYGFTAQHTFEQGTQPCEVCVSSTMAATAQVHSAKQMKFAQQRDLAMLYRHDSNRAVLGRDVGNYYKQHKKRWAAEQAKLAQEKENAEREKREAEAQAAAAEAAAAANRMAVKIVDKRAKKGGTGSPTSTGEQPMPSQPSAEDRSSSAPPADDKEEALPTCPNRRVEYVLVDAVWVQQWNNWLADDGTDVPAPPPTITSSQFVCPHGLSTIGLSDIYASRRRAGAIAVAVQPADVDAIRKHYGFDATHRLVELNDTRVVEPAECEECVAARRAAEEHEVRYFAAGNLRVAGKIRLTKRSKVDAGMELTNLRHDITVGELKSLISAQLLDRHNLSVLAEHISVVHDKTTMESDDATLSQCNILDGDTVTIDVSEAAAAVARMPARSAPADEWQTVPDDAASGAERTFHGSLLSGAAHVDPAAGAGAGDVVACSLCTFHNARGRARCEMCEAPLL